VELNDPSTLHTTGKPQCGTRPQLTDEADTSPPLLPSGFQFLQQVVRTLLYYARAVDNTMLVAIGYISSDQTKGTQGTLDKVTHLLNYCDTQPETVIRYHASNMDLHIQSNASCESTLVLHQSFFSANQPTD
jgi:hypothetical protein